ncbi:MAG: aminotransferase class I/II-fold pyridoxal phosphate-dependent enzyme [Lachnospiraceae bacterium]|nr:aminotransferase class I/II-fold pyridoxal phosphate-dependent enzyme [Lachnospiraceae bacterium]
MLQPTDQFHGSDLEKVEQLYHIRREEIRPFASNVNPLGLSPKLKEALQANLDILTEYPDREYTKLREAIHAYTGVDAAHVLPGSGATELIVTFITTVKPKKTIVVEPTYSEYKRDLKTIKSEIIDYVLTEDTNFQLDPKDLCKQIDDSVDMVILCNPNNPTSTCITISQIQEIAEKCKETSTFVLIDETYVEFVKDVPTISATPLVKKFNNLIVLRGVSKFFAAPGLRFGYACTSNDKLLRFIKKHANPWSVSSLAAYAGTVMFTDTDYMQATRDLILQEQSLVCSALRSRKTIQIIPPATNFVLIKLQKEGLTSAMVFEHCIKKGLMIRDCSNFIGLGPDYIRFCFLNPEDDDTLVNTLLEII